MEYDEDDLWIVPLENIVALSNPLKDNVWNCGRFSDSDFDECDDISLGEKPAEMTSAAESCSREYNIARILWLAENSNWLESDANPILIDIMRDTVDMWHPIADGNHRVAAAMLMCLDTLTVAVQGDLDFLEECLKPVGFRKPATFVTESSLVA